jgi:hypothetical protein
MLESRSKSLKQSYDVITLESNIYERRLFTFAKNAIFFNTNSREEHREDEKALAPIESLPIIIIGEHNSNFMINIRRAAVSSALWLEVLYLSYPSI